MYISGITTGEAVKNRFEWRAGAEVTYWEARARSYLTAPGTLTGGI
jgi:hypothetical protein